MKPFRKKIYATAGYNTVFFGSGRKEFNPHKPMPTFDTYLKDAAAGTCAQLRNSDFDEGVIANFMAPRYIKQANLPGFLPFAVPNLSGKPCTGVEGACGSGGRALAAATRSVLSDCAETVFVMGFEIQNTVKAIYGADILAGAAYYQGERKEGYAHFFPGIFATRAGAYYDRYGYEDTRRGMAKWYEQAILNARRNPKAQEYHNTTEDLFAFGMTPPDPKKFVPNLNLADCSKVTDGACAIAIASEEGLARLGVNKADAVEIIAIGAAEADITKKPHDPTILATTQLAVQKALAQAGITKNDLGLLELHDCFSIAALLALEAIGLAQPGRSPHLVLEGHLTKEGKLPTNLSGGLCGFGHPVGASGVRQLVDLQLQSTGKAANQVHPATPYGMMVCMGGNDVTLTALITKATS